MTIKLLYFAWLRERIGKTTEQVETNAADIAALIAELCAKGPEYELAFSDLDVIRASLNEELVELSSALIDGAEVAFFPPMTGG